MNKVFPGRNGKADGDVLTLDSTAPDEVSWQTPSGGGGGDSITVNTTAATNANFNDSLPAAGAGDLNVKWQIDTGATPDNVSAYVDVSVLEPLVSHALLLPASLVWTASAHVGAGSAKKIAGFDATDAAALYTVTGTSTVVMLDTSATIKTPTVDSYVVWTDTTGNAGATGRLQRNGANLSWHNGTAAKDLVQIGGQIGGTGDSSTVLGIRETGGPTLLTIASIADGEALYRTGSTVDGVTFATIAASVIQSSVITAVGYTTVNLPSCRFVTFIMVGAGGYGNDGVTGSNAANRAGGRGGGGGALTIVRCRRDQLPDSVEAYVASTVSAASPNQTFSCIEFTNSSLTAGGLATTLPNFSNLLGYALSGISSSGAGGNAASDASSVGLRVHNVRVLGGRASDAAATNNQPPDLTPFGASGTAPYSPGCSGAGKNTVPTAFIGGGFATAGNFGAVGGGTNPGGKGADASYYGGEGTWTTAANSVSELAVGYGGCGGGSHTAGTGGAGGVGSPGCGGGGGGAGTTGTASGAAGGNGFIIIECE